MKQSKYTLRKMNHPFIGFILVILLISCIEKQTEAVTTQEKEIVEPVQIDETPDYVL